MNKSPGFHFYPDKYISHTKHLCHLAGRIYMDILCWMWDHSPSHCQISTDPGTIALLTGHPLEDVKAAIFEIQNPAMKLLKEKGKLYISNGLKKEADKQATFAQKQSNSAKALWAQRKALKSSTTKVSQPYARAKKEKEKEKRKDPNDLPEGFKDFWVAYPKKKAKDDAIRAWVKLNPTSEIEVAILAALKWQCQLPDWKKENGQYVPFPASYLNGRRWTDEQEVKRVIKMTDVEILRIQQGGC